MTLCRSHSPVWMVRARVLWGAVLVCSYCAVSSFALADDAVAANAHAGRAETLFHEGLQLAEAGNTDAAIATFSRLTRDYPRLWQPYAQLAALYVRKGELTKAIVPLQTAVRLQSDAPALEAQLAELQATQSSQDFDR